MPRKIKFNVIYASSEDEKFRASELDEHGPTVKGWQSHKNCHFPQDLIFKLHTSVVLTQVQILAHQYLIPQKIELWLGPEELLECDVTELKFNYIGYITLSENKKSNYKSRELKSISVPTCKPTAYVRLTLEANHENSHNLYGQVSLVAVQLLGDAATESTLCDDLSFEMYVDKEVASIIRKMEKKKDEVVKAERFRYAGRLKSAIFALRDIGERLGRFEVSKQQAISNEDYSRANRKKEQIDLLRNEAYTALSVHDLLEEDGTALAKNDAPGGDLTTESNTPSEEVPPLPDTMETAGQPPGIYQSPLSPLHYTSPVGSKGQAVIIQPVRSGSLRRKKQLTPASPPASCVHTAAASAACANTNSYDMYDNRIIPPPVHRSLHEERSPTLHMPVLKMNEREKKQATLPISVFGRRLVEKFYSRHYSDKEEGVRILESMLRQGELEETRNKVARGATFLLHRALRDKVFSVYSMAANTVEYFFNSFVSNRVSPSEIGRSVDKILPELLSKSGDATPRIHNTAVHTILSMAHAQELRKLNLIPVHITRPLTSAIHPRLALSRLEIAEQLILSLGISNDKNSGMTARVLAEFGSSGLHHPAEAVRKVAERILVLVYKVNPRMVRKQLPPDDDITRRNLLYRQLMKEFDKIDSETKKEQPQGGEERRLTRSGSVTERDRRDTSSAGEHRSGSGLKTSASCYAANLPPSPSPPPSPHHQDRQCIFCYMSSDKFTEEGLNIHYWKYCPMLTRCTDCGEVVEIPSLGSHRESKCAFSGDREQGVEARCPFCKLIVENTDKGWRHHLVDGRTCTRHPRASYLNTSSPPSKDI